MIDGWRGLTAVGVVKVEGVEGGCVDGVEDGGGSRRL